MEKRNHHELFRMMGAPGEMKNAHLHTKHERLDMGSAGPRAYRDTNPIETDDAKSEIGPKKYKDGGKAKRQRLAAGAVAKIRKNQY